MTAAAPLSIGVKRVYCYHIRKTGGTSLHRAFLALGGEDPADVHEMFATSPRVESNGYVFVAHRSALLQEGNYFYGWSHKPAHEIVLPEATFTVVILRDPVARVLSHHRMLLEAQIRADPASRTDPRHRALFEGREPPFPAPRHELSWLGQDLGEFLDRLPREHLLRQLYMFSATFDIHEAADRLVQCSHVFFCEHYAAGLASLAEKLRLPLQMRHVRASSVQTQYSAGELDRLREQVEPEHRLLEALRARGAISSLRSTGNEQTRAVSEVLPAHGGPRQAFPP